MPAWRGCKVASQKGCSDCTYRRSKSGQEQHQCRLSRNLVCKYTAMIKSRSPTPSVRREPPPLAESDLLAQYGDLMSSVNPPTGDLNIQELELMTQWCTETHRSVSRSKSVEWIWHAVIPREAMHHPFLAHGILAISALHLAFTRDSPSKGNYMKTAQIHHQNALSGLKRVTANLNKTNTNAVFASCSIAIVSSFAFPLTLGLTPESSVLDDLCHIFQHTKASAGLMGEIVSHVAKGELAPLVECDNTQPRMPDTSKLAIITLLQLNTSLSSRDVHHEKNVYEVAIKHLGESLEALAQGAETMIVAFQWIFQIPNKFIQLVHERRAFSLVVLAHYAVILHSLRGYWWMGDWGARVIRDSGRYLDAEWRGKITWVIDATGCYIPPV